jgi:hypothetical protein
MPTEAQAFKEFYDRVNPNTSDEVFRILEVELVNFLREWHTIPATLAADHIELMRKKLDAQPQ